MLKTTALQQCILLQNRGQDAKSDCNVAGTVAFLPMHFDGVRGLFIGIMAKIAIDSFALFRNKIAIKESFGTVAYEIPRYDLKAVLRESSYAVQYSGGEYTISVEKQPCTFGGFRYFFRCPQCDKRMRILYCVVGRFLCRRCHNLGYFTQVLTPSVRCIIMQAKIQGYLKDRGGSPDKKPVWMKRKTFDALVKRHDDYMDVKYLAAGRKEFLKRYPDKVAEADFWFDGW